MPNMCPAAIIKNQYLAEKLSKSNIHFILLSFDHIYDNPSTLNTGRNSGAMGGDQIAALFCGGSTPTTAAVEEFNGSSWSETTDLNTARGQAAAV